MLNIDIVTCLKDNYSFIIRDTKADIVAVIDPKNRASQNVLERAGFSNEGDRSAYKKTSLGFRVTKLDWLKRSQENKKI